MEKGFKDIEEYFLSVAQKGKRKSEKVSSMRAKLSELKEKVLKLERENEELKRAYEEATLSRIQLIMEVALLSSLSSLLEQKGKKVLLSKEFRVTLSRIMVDKPLIFQDFLSGVKDFLKRRSFRVGESEDLTINSHYGKLSVRISAIDGDTLRFESVSLED